MGGIAPRPAPESGPELAERLIQLRHAIDFMELSFAQTAADFASTDEYDEQGSVSPIDWIRIHCHMTQTAAGASVAVGEHLDELESSTHIFR